MTNGGGGKPNCEYANPLRNRNSGSELGQAANFYNDAPKLDMGA